MAGYIRHVYSVRSLFPFPQAIISLANPLNARCKAVLITSIKQEQVLQTRPFCAASQVKPYHRSTWLDLNTHFEDDEYLEVVLHRAKCWRTTIKRPRPVSQEFLGKLQAPGVTKEVAQDLIDEFGAKDRTNGNEEEELVTPFTLPSHKRKADQPE